MNRLFPSLALALVSSGLAAAPQPSQPAPLEHAAQPVPPSLERQQLARHYISLTVSPDGFIADMRTAAAAALTAKFEQAQGASREEAEGDMRRFFALFEPKARERLPNYLEAYAQVYAREFSVEELQKMIAFAQSPAGRHYFSREERLDVDPAIRTQAEGFWLDMVPIFQQIRKEKCAVTAARRVAAGEKNAKCPLSSAPETQAG